MRGRGGGQVSESVFISQQSSSYLRWQPDNTDRVAGFGCSPASSPSSCYYHCEHFTTTYCCGSNCAYPPEAGIDILSALLGFVSNNNADSNNYNHYNCYKCHCAAIPWSQTSFQPASQPHVSQVSRLVSSAPL